MNKNETSMIVYTKKSETNFYKTNGSCYKYGVLTVNIFKTPTGKYFKKWFFDYDGEISPVNTVNITPKEAMEFMGSNIGTL